MRSSSSSDYVGAQGFTEFITKMMGVLELAPSTEMTYFAHGGRVAIYYHLTLTSRASGQSVEMHVTEVFSVRQGRITELDVFYKSRLRWLLC